MILSETTTLFEVVRQLPHLLATLPIDDSSISVLAMLAGLVGGWTLTDWHKQLKAKRVKVERQRQQLRKPE
ncbi:MAG: hypothetical protein IRZ28_08805 [Steroidobacteraceae bacterium]|nr:hypothetical protein [Steroidobacteraceae bacterium]